MTVKLIPLVCDRITQKVTHRVAYLGDDYRITEDVRAGEMAAWHDPFDGSCTRIASARRIYGSWIVYPEGIGGKQFWKKREAINFLEELVQRKRTTTTELPLWFTKDPLPGRAPGLGCRLESEGEVAVIYTPVDSVKWRSDCQYCTQHCMGQTDFFPTHEAGRNCESGKHSHCTCDSCF